MPEELTVEEFSGERWIHASQLSMSRQECLMQHSCQRWFHFGRGDYFLAEDVERAVSPR